MDSEAGGIGLAVRGTGLGESELFHLSDADFERVRRLIYQHAGISLSESKRSMVYSRLVRRLRALGDPDFATYLDRVRGGAGPEWQQFVNALTTNLTSFYREAHHFPMLADHLRRLPGKARLRIWCCAASTGEEAYTIAFTVVEAIGAVPAGLEIIATDIDTNVLERARAGIYREDTVAKLEQAQLKRFFLRGRGANQGMVRVRPEIRALVHFEKLNLLDREWSVGGDFAAIFCRNVMIYFDKETQLRLAARLAQAARPDGLLFFGHSENLSAARDVLESCGHTVYRPVAPAAR